MRNLKKFLALVLAMMMVFSLMITVNAAGFDDYTDAGQVDAKYKTGVEVLSNIGIFRGTSSTSAVIFSPKQEITRAEMAAIIYRVMTGDVKDENIKLYESYDNDFEDVTDEWFAPYVNYANNARLVVGDGNGHFYPMTKIDGYQVLAILLRALGYTQPGEFEGKDWQTHTAQIGAQLHITDNLAYTLSHKTPREVVAQMTYNTAIKTDRVRWTPAGGYSSTSEKLIELGTNSRTVDEWGVMTTETPYTFTYPEVDVTSSYSVQDKPLYEFYGPMTQCDVADNSGVDGVFTTYTNGLGNKATQVIDDTETIKTIGAQGRWTRIFADRIVYMDTVLAQVTSVTPATYDTAGHMITPASSTVTLYGNSAMQGLEGEGQTPGWSTFPGAAVTAAVDTNSTTYRVSGSFTPGQIITANILTGTTNNQLTGGLPYNPKTGAAYTSAIAAGFRLRNAVEATATPVTIQAIVYGDTSATSTTPVGFIGTNGVKYLYDVTYSYYLGNVTNGAAVVTLGTTAIGRTFNVYTDGRNNVLGLVPVTNAANYGVVLNVMPVSLGTVNATNGKLEYALEWTILTPAGNTVTVRSICTDSSVNASASATNPLPYELSQAETAAGGKVRTLVSYTANAANSNYYDIVIGTTDTQTQAFKVGVADAMQGGNKVLVDDDTVFFIANYNESQSVVTGGGYVVSSANYGYSIYTGFKTFVNDLAPGGKGIYANGSLINAGTSLTYYYFDTDFVADGYADYVLVLNATEKTPITDRAVPAPNYAYIQFNREQYVAYDDYYLFNALLNGTANTLKLNNVSGQTIATSTYSGLYAYKADSTNGTNSIQGGGVANKITLPNNGDATYQAGVLKLNSSAQTIANYNGTGAAMPNPNNGGTTLTYLTVADNAQIWIVNPSNGKAVLSSYNMQQILDIYGEYGAITAYFQTNQYGWANLIYVVDNTTVTPATAVTAVTIGLAATAGDDILGSITVNSTTPGAKNASIASIKWEKGVSGVWTTVNPGVNHYYVKGDVYRVTVTLKANSGYYLALPSASAFTVSAAGATAGTVTGSGATYTFTFTVS